MSLPEYPEVRLANRVIQKHSLTPPINVRSLLELYATVIFESIPIENVDGVAVDIKVPGKKPVIIIDPDSPLTRQNFTMAHELGHLLIPWHIGIKIDENDPESIQNEIIYSGIEAEANRFASALLMPSSYIQDVVSTKQNLAKAHEFICQQLTVSAIAAAIRMAQVLEPGIVYCAVRNNFVEYAGRTDQTPYRLPTRYETFDTDFTPFDGEHSVWQSGSSWLHWWKMEPKAPVSLDHLVDDPTDKRTWKKIFAGMIKDLHPEEEEAIEYRKSISGAIGALNGSMLRNEKIEYNSENLMRACYERLTSEPYKGLEDHKDFNLFLIRRVKSLLAKKNKRA